MSICTEILDPARMPGNLVFLKGKVGMSVHSAILLRVITVRIRRRFGSNGFARVGQRTDGTLLHAYAGFVIHSRTMTLQRVSS